MRQLSYLFSIVLVAACGCGKNPPGQTPAGTPTQTTNQAPTRASAQTANPIPVPASPQTSDDSLFPRPDPNRPYVDVDVVVQNSLSNEYWFIFDSDIDSYIPAKIYSAGESVTNTGVSWGNWQSIQVSISEEGIGGTHILDIPMARINDQLATGKYHRMLFQITDSDKVEVSCE
jgi:hypothetical protein